MLELRILHFEDLTVGMSESFSKVVSSSDVVGFAELTGDRNPIHLAQHSVPRGFRRDAHVGRATFLISAGEDWREGGWRPRGRTAPMEKYPRRIKPRLV